MTDEINTQATPEVSADLNDIDVSDIDFGADTEAEPSEETTEETTPETDEADPQKQTEDEADKDETKTEEQPKETDQFTLKHLDEVKSVSKDEVIALAQKGMDYDRLKAKSEERYAALVAEKAAYDTQFADLTEIATDSGYKDVAEMIDGVKAAKMVERGDCPDVQTALKQIRLDKREKALAEKEKSSQTAVDAKTKIDSDARAFIDKFPSVDFATIPKEVWDKVNAGASLVDAYREHTDEKAKSELAAENKRLKDELEATKKNADNKARSTGSIASAGKESTKDAWLSDFESRA